MPKHSIIILILFSTFKLFSQSNLNYFYSDTVFEIDHMRFEIKGTVAYRDNFKVQVYVTNFTDSFKIIQPNNVKLKLKDGKEYYPAKDGIYVIAPKGSEKFRITFTGADFKENFVSLGISDIQTTANPDHIYNFGYIILDDILLREIKEKTQKHYIAGPVDIYIKDFKYKPNAVVAVKLYVKYNADNFLGFFIKNALLADNFGKTHVNVRFSRHYYRNEKKDAMIYMQFQNPYGKSEQPHGDMLILNNVFLEYKPIINKNTYSIILSKSGEGKGNPKKEEQNDIEVIED